jgi:hypothetical protein
MIGLSHAMRVIVPEWLYLCHGPDKPSSMARRRNTRFGSRGSEANLMVPLGAVFVRYCGVTLMSLRDWALVVLVGCLFGSSFLLIVIVLEELGPLTITAGRSLVAAIACWAFLLASRKPITGDRGLLLKLCLLGLFSYALPFVLMPISQRYVPTSLGAIINLMLPTATLAVSHFDAYRV